MESSRFSSLPSLLLPALASPPYREASPRQLILPGLGQSATSQNAKEVAFSRCFGVPKGKFFRGKLLSPEVSGCDGGHLGFLALVGTGELCRFVSGQGWFPRGALSLQVYLAGPEWGCTSPSASLFGEHLSLLLKWKGTEAPRKAQQLGYQELRKNQDKLEEWESSFSTFKYELGARRSAA